MMNEQIPSIESLSLNAQFLRAFARALVRGDSEVDDIVQDTFAVALERSPTRPESLRAFLKGILRNLSLRRGRDAATRNRHLPHLPAPRTEPTPQEIATREETRRRVVAALLVLPESYRRPLILRYYEGLSHREVASRLGVPLETARTRMKRGLQRLRRELDDKHDGSRTAWASALIPLISAPHTIAAAVLAKVAAAVLLVVVAGAGVWTFARDASPPPPPEALASVPDQDAPPLNVPALSEASPAGRRATGGRAADSELGSILVRIVDSDGRPMKGTEVRLRIGEYAVLTDAQGLAKIPLVDRSEHTLMVQPPGWRYLFVDFAEGQKSIEIVIPTPSRRSIRGVVVDETGRALANAFVIVVRPGDLRGWAVDPKHATAQLDFLRDHVKRAPARTTSGAAGSFSMLVTAGKDHVMMAVKEGYLAERTVLRQDAKEVRLIARRGATLRVHLVGPDGSLEGGLVGLAHEGDPDYPANFSGPTTPLVISPLFPGRWTILEAWDISEDLVTLDPVEVVLAAGEVRDIELRLAPLPPSKLEWVGYRVRILDADGSPMNLEEIDRFTETAKQRDRVHIGWGDARGYKKRAGIEGDGSVRFSVPRGENPWVVIRRNLAMPECRFGLPGGGGKHDIRLPVRLAEMVYSLRGRILDPDGKPLLAAYVTLTETAHGHHLSTTTDIWGRFCFDRLLPPPWSLWGYDREFSPSSLKLNQAPATEVVLRLGVPREPEAVGKLTIRLLTTRADFSRAVIRLHPPRGSLRPGPTGEVSKEIRPGAYAVSTALPIQGGLILDAGTAIIREGETTTLDLCREGLVETLLRGAGEDTPHLIHVAAVDAEGKAIAYGSCTWKGARLRVLFPKVAAGLALNRVGHEAIRFDAPRGDITVRWRKVAPR